MLLLYLSPTALHSRKAREWLQDRHIPFQERNIFSSVLSPVEFQDLWSLLGWANKSGLSLFGLSAPSSLDLKVEEYYRILCEAPENLQRPILKGDRHIEIGFSEEKFQQFLLREGIEFLP